MEKQEDEPTEKTYRAIGRFMFEFSQVEYAIRYYLAEEICLKEDYFSALMESCDVSMLISVAIEVFRKSRGVEAETIWKLLNKFRRMNDEFLRIAPFLSGALPQQHWMSRRRHLTGGMERAAFEHSLRAVVSCLRRKRFDSKRLDVTDQVRSQPTAPKRVSNYDVQNAGRVLFENEHSDQDRTFSEGPDPPCPAFTLHPFQVRGVIVGTADMFL